MLSFLSRAAMTTLTEYFSVDQST